MDRIDFRSDTVSWPTSAMQAAMAKAPIGDDVYGEDPSVNRLEALAAAKVGKEAGLFVASGTMGNLCAILAHTTRGDEAICGMNAHTFRSEAGGMATLGGVVPKPIPIDKYGRMNMADMKAAVSPDDPHKPHTQLVLVENSFGNSAGYPLPPAYFAEIYQFAQTHQLRVHMDGARLFNAAVACQVDAREITRHVDTVTFCLSKGLCAPVGSVLCGSEDFIYRARRARKVVGGGMRQAGILAAAGIVALNEMIERLEEDHKHARRLAAGLVQISGICLDMDMVQTNMVFFKLPDTGPLTHEEFIVRLREEAGIWLETGYGDHLRAVTHYWIGVPEVDLFIEKTASILA